MADATNRRRRAKTPVTPAGLKPILAIDADPQSWLFLNPTGPNLSGLVYGVLRKTYGSGQRQNSSAEFALRKLRVFPPVNGVSVEPWSITAERAEVLLPPGAEDRLLDPATLFAEVDAAAVPHEKALLTYLTLPLLDAQRTHAGWELCRDFVRSLVRDRSLAGALLVLHAPGRANSANPLHCHVLLIPRRWSPLGLAHSLYDEDLTHDAGQVVVEQLWTAHKKSFR